MSHRRDRGRKTRSAAAALCVALSCCATAAGAATNPPESRVSAVVGFSGTAYLKTSNTVLYADKPYGFTRAGAQGLVDQCNGFRKAYNVAPVAPPEATMASLDVFLHEKYFDTNKALTVITGKLLTLTDMPRWMADYQVSATSGALPASPPDCTQIKLTEVRNGTLWRDGVVYELRYAESKAIGRRVAVKAAPSHMAAAFAEAVPTSRLGQTCREISGVIDLSPQSQACVWDLFPYVAYLNWPFVLSGRVQFGPMPGLFETIVPVAAEHGQAIPASVFEIPPGFTVIPPRA